MRSFRMMGIQDCLPGAVRMESTAAPSSDDPLRERLRRHVDVLAELIGERNSVHREGIEAAKSFLLRELRNMGLSPAQQPYATRTRVATNVEVVFQGSKRHLPALVVGAHYDSAIGTPGADDNASAVAILLEIVRELTTHAPKRTVRCVFYDCEEPPHFNLGEMGSREHARQLRAAGERLVGMICLESLGYFVKHPEPAYVPPWYVQMINRAFGGLNVVLVSDLRSILFWLRFSWTFLRSGRFPCIPVALPRKVSVIELSDHRAYWDEGYRAVMVTNTAIMRNPNYHQPTDRLATLDLDRMTRLCRQLTTCTLRLAGRDNR